MKFNQVVETHITDTGMKYDTVLTAIQKRFPDRKVKWLTKEDNTGIAGIKISGTITDKEARSIDALIRKTIEKTEDEADSENREAKHFMKDWSPSDIPLPTDDVLRALRESIDEMLGYVESHRKDDPVMARSFATDSEDMVIVYNLWHAKDFKAAAKYLRELDTIVRDRVPSKQYSKIMEHLPR